MTTNSIRVALLTNIPTPYRIPFFNRLAEEDGIELKVLFMSDTEANRQWQLAGDQFAFDYKVLDGWHAYLGKWEIPVHINKAVWRELSQFNPDVIVTTGYENPTYWQALAYRKVHNKRFVLWSGTTALSARHVNGPVSMIKRAVVAGADACYSYGTEAAAYLEDLGASRGDIHIGVNTVDMESFRQMAESQAQSGDVRKKREQYPPFLLLYSGQLIERKGVFTLLHALRQLDDEDTGLLLVGGGPQEAELNEYCRQQGLRNVFFEKFQQYCDIPAYYAMADVTVMPSLAEVWGLVVNESLAAGTYVLCSDRAGVGQDLIKDGWNGAMFDPTNVKQLAGLIGDAKANLCDIRARRQAISDHACREFGIEQSVKPMLEAIRAVYRQ
jgi:glycosyltransferase involved in cell wall biosynthesis